MNQMHAVSRVATVSRYSKLTIVPTRATYIRRRLMVCLVLAFALFAAVSFATGQAQATGSGQASTSFTYVSVHSGDTLWSLADTYSGDTDPRDWIASLVTLNSLESNSLQPGQQLALPLG